MNIKIEPYKFSDGIIVIVDIHRKNTTLMFIGDELEFSTWFQDHIIEGVDYV